MVRQLPSPLFPKEGSRDSFKTDEKKAGYRLILSSPMSSMILGDTFCAKVKEVYEKFPSHFHS